MDGYIDTVNEDIFLLEDNEIYVVAWFKYDNGGLIQNADISQTKQKIIENISLQKYREGATIWKMKIA